MKESWINNTLFGQVYRVDDEDKGYIYEESGGKYTYWIVVTIFEDGDEVKCRHCTQSDAKLWVENGEDHRNFPEHANCEYKHELAVESALRVRYRERYGGAR